LRTTSSILADLARIVNASESLRTLQFFAECFLKNRRQYEWKRVPGCASSASRTVSPITMQATIMAARTSEGGIYRVKYKDKRFDICTNLSESTPAASCAATDFFRAFHSPLLS